MKLTKKQGMAAGIGAILIAALALALTLGTAQQKSAGPAVTPEPPAQTGDSLIPTKSQAPAADDQAEQTVGVTPPAGTTPPAAKTAVPNAVRTASPGTTVSKAPSANPSAAAQQPGAAETAANTPQPQVTQAPEQKLVCTLTVRCDSVLANMDRLKKEKQAIIPADGILYQGENIAFFAEETVFNVLQRELKKNQIHFDFAYTPGFDTAYIKGIANLYERDAGDLSGWLYKVNGAFIQTGASQYKLSPGDQIEWVYTCDGGRDVGAEPQEG